MNEFKAAVHVYGRFGCLPIGRFDPSILSKPFLSASRGDTVCRLGI